MKRNLYKLIHQTILMQRNVYPRQDKN